MFEKLAQVRSSNIIERFQGEQWFSRNLVSLVQFPHNPGKDSISLVLEADLELDLTVDVKRYYHSNLAVPIPATSIRKLPVRKLSFRNEGRETGHVIAIISTKSFSPELFVPTVHYYTIRIQLLFSFN